MRSLYLAQNLDSMLAALTHPRAAGSAAIRQNVLRPLPALLQKCGGTMRSSLDQVVPNVAERLVDADSGVRSLAARALLELLTVVTWSFYPFVVFFGWRLMSLSLSLSLSRALLLN